MVRGHEPSEITDNHISVIVRRDSNATESIDCRSYEEAIDVVKDRVSSTTIVKIEAPDGETVFSSVNEHIEDWERGFERAKTQASMDFEEHECSYNNAGCMAGQLCGQCKMDKVRDQF